MNIFRRRREHLPAETLSEYLSGRLPSEEARRVEAHAEVCGVCREELDSLGYTVGLMRRVPMAAPRRDFTLPHAPVDVPLRGPVSWLPGWSYAAAASVAAVVFAAVLSADVTGLLAEEAAGPPVVETRLEQAEGAAPSAPTSISDGASAAFDLEEPSPTSAPAQAATVSEEASAQPAGAPRMPAATVPETGMTAPVEEAVQAQAEVAGALSAVEDRSIEPALAPAGYAEESAAEVDITGIQSKEEAPPAVSDPAPAVMAASAPASAAEADVPLTATNEAAAPTEAYIPTPAVEVVEPLPATGEADGPTDLRVVEVGGSDATGVPAAASIPTSPPAEPDAPPPVPASTPVQDPGVTLPAAAAETTSILWRIVEGVAAGLALAAGGTFLWMRRRARTRQQQDVPSSLVGEG